VEITGTASDNVGVARVRIAVQDPVTKLWLRPDGSFGTYASFDATLDSANATATGWSLTINGLAPGEYAVSARAFDAAGNADLTRPRHRFTHS
jgi:hypothetical protein